MTGQRKKKKDIRWEVLRVKGSSPAFEGIVSAPNEKSALKAAITKLKINNPEHQKRLIVRRNA
jgi:hypothetical protein